MSSWLLRGVVMSIVHVAARIILGAIVIAAPLSSPLARWLTIAVVIVVAMIWGGLDGLKDARAHSDPDDYEDLTVRWLKAGLFAGVVSCFISWILGTVWLNGIGQASFFTELLAGTSFIALIVFVPAFFGVTVGRFLIRREQRKAELAAEEAAEAQTQVVATA